MPPPDSPKDDDSGKRAGLVTRLFAELRRRKVISTAGVYLVGSFVAMQVVDDVVPYLPLVTNPEQAGRVVLIALIAGFPVAMVLSWVFQFTPPHLAREVTREEVEQLRRLTTPAAELRADTLAVLPFENLSGEPEDVYFADGVTDDVMMALAQIRGLRVLPRTTVSRPDAGSRSVWQIAGDLRSAIVVTGSVRRSGSRVRVVVVAVDARTEDRLWSDTYDRDLDDIFRVQSEIASNVADAIACEMSPADRRRIEDRGTRDGEAYDLFLRARFLWNQRTEASLTESLGYFRRAIERDPDFALAHAGVADALAILGVYGMRAPLDAFAAARHAVDRALTLDPSLGEARATGACISGLFEWDWQRAQAEFVDAMELAPSYATARQWYAMNVLTPLGRFDEAREQLEAAAQFDPGSGAIATSRGVVAFYARDLEEAAAQLTEAVQHHPHFALAHYFLGRCLDASGQADWAVPVFKEATRLAGESSETLAGLGHALGRGGNHEEADAVLSRLVERSKQTYVSSVLLARVSLGLGRHAAAMTHLAAALDERATDLAWLGVGPEWDPLRADPEFSALLARLGLDPT